VSKKEKIKSGDGQITGHVIQVKVVKSKVSQPYLTSDIEFRFTSGINLVTDLIDAGIAAGIIVKDNTSYLYSGRKLSVGYDAAVKAVTSNAGLQSEIRAAVAAKLEELKGTPVSSVMTEVKGEAIDEDRPRKRKTL
jgi:hypothetical protein